MIIKEYETGEHCFGPILTVNGVDYNDLEQEDVIKFINDMFRNNLNSGLLIRECFKTSLAYLLADIVEYNSDSCEQCGNFNSYAKYVVDNENFD
jgi:hypothetical protein